MLRQALTHAAAAMAAVAAVSFLQGPASAASAAGGGGPGGGFGGTQCGQGYTPSCAVTAGSPGSGGTRTPKTASTAPSARSVGGSTASGTCGGTPDKTFGCVPPGCRITAQTLACPIGIPAAGGQPARGGPPAPVALARIARRYLLLPAPQIRSSPAQADLQLTGLPTWQSDQLPPIWQGDFLVVIRKAWAASLLPDKGVPVKIAIHRSGRPSPLQLLYGSLALGAVAAAAACGSTSSSTAASPGRSQPAGTSSAASSSSAVTISAKSVQGVGTILVNSKGQTLYMLTSEKGGKITCTDDNGCTKVWPDTELPKGVTSATAGSGIQASLLGTVKNSAGDLYVTYHGWPLYTYTGDNGPGQKNGEGITAFGGTWYVLSASGSPVTSSHSQSGNSGSGGGSNGY